MAGKGGDTCMGLVVSDSMLSSTTSVMGWILGGSIHAGGIPEWELLKRELKNLWAHHLAPTGNTMELPCCSNFHT